jgi:hypothetical protein
MSKKETLQLFEDRKVRTAWDSDHEKWYFSVVDVCGVLTDSDYQTARKYWKVLKGRLKREGNESVTNCYQLNKQYKGLKKENLRDNMTDLEIAINMLAEATTTQISKNENPKGMSESAYIARRGGQTARTAREAAEREIGQSIVSPDNARTLTSTDSPQQIETNE